MTETQPQPQTTAIKPAARLAGLRPYLAQPLAPTIDLRLDANEGVPPSDAVLAAFRSINAEDLRRYPDASSLEQRLAARFDIDASRVVVTNGGDDAIDRVCRAVVEPGREMLTHTPSFVMIPRSARLAGGDVRSLPWTDGPFPVQAMIEAITDRTSLIALVSPNNPTGGTLTTNELLAIARAGARAGVLVMVDLAYVEFSDHDPCAQLLDEPNVVVIRTMSKAFGLASARVGYAIAQPDVAEWLRTVGGPYPVSLVSVALAAHAIAATDDRAGVLAETWRERDELADLLHSLGADPFPSQANFITARFNDAASVHVALASMGILVRSFGTTPGLEQSLRITLPGRAADFERLCDALRTILTPSSAR